MSIYNFDGYLAQPRQSLGGKLIGFNVKTGMPVKAAAGFGSYSDLSTDFYKTFQPDNWQHAGGEGWTQAPVPGWGENPNLQMFPRRAAHGLGEMEVLALALSAVALGVGATGYFAYKAAGAKGLGIAAGVLGAIYFVRRGQVKAQDAADLVRIQKGRESNATAKTSAPTVVPISR